jgi:hypothetical protein
MWIGSRLSRVCNGIIRNFSDYAKFRLELSDQPAAKGYFGQMSCSWRPLCISNKTEKKNPLQHTRYKGFISDVIEFQNPPKYR